MTRLFLSLLSAVALVLSPSARAEFDHDHDHDHDHKHEHDHADQPHSAHDHEAEAIVVHVDSRARHILNMQIEPIPQTSLALSQSLYGHLIIPGHALETYALPCAGRIHLRVMTAQQVQKGDVLYSLTSPDYAAQLAEVQTLQAELERCQTELDAIRSRITRLGEAGTRNSELEAQLMFKVAESTQLTHARNIAERRVQILTMGAEPAEENGLPVLLVRAQTDGVVNNVGVAQNSWGEQGSAVITMTNPAAMEIVGTLYASDLPNISEVRASLPLGRENVLLEGTWRLAEQVDATTQTRRLYFTPTNLPDKARAGQLCRLDIYDAPAEPGIVSVPDSAVVKVGTDDAVFIEVNEETYAMVKVHAGASKRGMTPVSGLRPGQRVVVKGGYELKYILPGEKDTKKAGHFHADGVFHESDDHDDH